MTDRVLDKSTFEIFSDAGQAQLGAAETTSAVNWLDSLANDSSGTLIDAGYRLLQDYAPGEEETNALWQVLRGKPGDWPFRLVAVTRSGHQAPHLPTEWSHLDEHRRWVLAVSQVAPWSTRITNATCQAWHPTRLPADVDRPEIEQILPDWLERQIPAPAAIVVSQHHPAPRQLAGALAAAAQVGVGTNGRRAWEDATNRYEWDFQEGRVEVYRLADGRWLREADESGNVTKTSGGAGRRWGKR